MILTNYPLTSGSYLVVLHNNRCPRRKEHPVSPYFHFISIAHQIVFGQFIQTGAVPVFSLYQTLPISRSTLQVHYCLICAYCAHTQLICSWQKNSRPPLLFPASTFLFTKIAIGSASSAFIRLYTILIHFYKTMLPQCFRCQTAGQNSIIHLVVHCYCKEHGSQSHARWQSVLHVPIPLPHLRMSLLAGALGLVTVLCPPMQKNSNARRCWSFSVVGIHFRYISIIREADTINLFTIHYYLLLSKNRPFLFSEK